MHDGSDRMHEPKGAVQRHTAMQEETMTQGLSLDPHT